MLEEKSRKMEYAKIERGGREIKGEKELKIEETCKKDSLTIMRLLFVD